MSDTSENSEIAVSDSFPDPSGEAGPPSTSTSAIQKTIDAWKASKARAKELDNRAKRTTDRAEYRIKREKMGLTVRPYRFHAHEARRPEENHEDHQKRIHRDGQRAKRGVTAETVRTRTDLSQMTPEQRAEHKTLQAAKRKSEQRKRDSAAAQYATTTDADRPEADTPELRGSTGRERR